jgi:hypothetical protein
MPKYYMLNWEDSLFFKGQNRERKEKVRTSSDEPTVHFVDAPDELQRKRSEDSSTGWSNGLSEDTIGLSDAQFESRQRRVKMKSLAPDELMPWSRGSVGLSDGHVEARCFGRGVFSTGWTDAPSVYSVGAVVSADLQRLRDMEGTGWTDA